MNNFEKRAHIESLRMILEIINYIHYTGLDICDKGSTAYNSYHEKFGAIARILELKRYESCCEVILMAHIMQNEIKDRLDNVK